MLSILIVAVLKSVFVRNEAACSSHSERTVCSGDADCFWSVGKCGPFTGSDCGSNCKIGCVYTPGSLGKCVDSVADACAALDESSCSVENTCTKIEGSCVSDNPPVCSDYSGDCPTGCFSVDTPVCEGGGSQPPKSEGCVGKGLEILTDCTRFRDCEWDDGQCKYEYEGEGEGEGEDEDERDCSLFSNKVYSQCSSVPVCKVSSNACVYDASGCETLSSRSCGFNISSLFCEWRNDGESGNYSNGTGNYTNGTGNYTNESGNYSNSSGSGNYSNGTGSGSCVARGYDFCGWYSLDVCVVLGDGFCKVSGGKCVFVGCESFSTQSSTECGLDKYCKVSAGKCTDMTSDEICSFNSVEKNFTECSKYSCCEVNDQICQPKTDLVEECQMTSCSNLSTLLISNCDWDPSCQINDLGACVSFAYTPPTCELNLGKTGCDNPNDCWFHHERSCKNVECESLGFTNSNDCEGHTVISDYHGQVNAGCTWSSSGGSCLPASQLCSVSGDGTCVGGNTTGCTSIDPVPARCDVDTSVSTDALCNPLSKIQCGSTRGCRWNANDGGTCIEKTCASNPSYSRCCSDRNCAYCSGMSRPADCPPETCESKPSYSRCCTDLNCAYCSKEPKPSDCPLDQCKTSPSYANCCPGDQCDAFCAENPNDEGCRGNAGSHIYTPFVALLLFLLITSL